MDKEKITTIYNQHIEDCGSPPSIQFEEYEYVSYFENAHGEQSIFLFDADKMEVIVYVADAGWDNPVKIPGSDLVKNGSPEGISQGIVPSEAEIKWLQACKEAISPKIEYLLEKSNS